MPHSGAGNIISIIDGDGSPVIQYKYSAFGSVSSTWQLAALCGLTDNPFQHRGAFGYLYDMNTGHYYLKNRFYNPDLARFISPDKALGKVGAVFSHNIYAYCAGNPVMRVDPDGLSAKNPWIDKIRGFMGNVCAELINGICGGEMVSESGKFQLTSITRSTIKSLEREAYNNMVRDNAVNVVAALEIGFVFMTGGLGPQIARMLMVLGMNKAVADSASTLVGNLGSHFGGGSLSSIVAEPFIGIGDGPYTLIRCSYTSETWSFKSVRNYEIKLYDEGVYEVWVSYNECYFLSDQTTATPPQKIGVRELR